MGLTSPALRALGPNRTLVLLDGQRSVPSAMTGEVDTSTFPQLLVNRVEVVTGGASAAYGSDAVAGVINYVLDKEFTGFKSEVGAGVSKYGDDENWKADLARGFPFADGRGHALLSGEFYETDGISDIGMGRGPSATGSTTRTCAWRTRTTQRPMDSRSTLFAPTLATHVRSKVV